MDKTTISENTGNLFSPSPRRRKNTGGSSDTTMMPSPRRTPLRALPRNNNSISDMSSFLVEPTKKDGISTPSPLKAMKTISTKGQKTPNVGKLLSPLPLQPRKLSSATKVTIDMDEFLSQVETNHPQPAISDDHTGGFLRSGEASLEGSLHEDLGLHISPAFDEGDSIEGAYSIEDFKCIRMLGSGGTAKVYQVLELATSAMYALKVQKSTDDALCELDVHIPLRHSNVCQVIDYFYCKSPPFQDPIEVEKEDTHTYLCTILELCDGGDLHSVIDQHVTVPEKLAAKYAMDAIRALEYIHSTGTIHCDIKPANWLVDGRGEESVVKLADFGMAVTNTNKEIVGGSPVYMAPEHLLAWRDMSDNFDHRSDIYSLGVVLYEMLMGYLPYEVLEAGEETNNNNNSNVMDSIANEFHQLSVASEQRDDVDDTFQYPVLDLRKLNDVSSEEPFYIPPPIFVEEISPEAQDLILSLMEPSAKRRISLEEAKNHEWFSKWLLSPNP